jgi:hypothetical protein
LGQHRLLNDDTLWIFVTCSQEARHLDDVVFGVDVLRARGVANDRILVFCDHSKVAPHLDPYAIPTRPVTSLAAELSSLPAHRHAVVIVGGHGHVAGLGNIPAPPSLPILPAHQLFSAVRGIPGLALGIVILSQCYGGVFNYADALAYPQLVVIGATNLNPSLSMTISIRDPIRQADGSEGLRTWLANIFTVAFFSWLRSPTDIDGDGRNTLMDAYKHAGATSNEMLRSGKSGLFVQARKLEKSVGETEEQLANVAPDVDPTGLTRQLLTLQLGAQRQQLAEVLQNLYLHQEPWVLHANLAREALFV